MGNSDSPAPDESELRHEVYSKFPSVTHDIVSQGKNAFEENRIAAYSVLKAIAMHEWGLSEIHSHSPILGLLLDRASETSRLGKVKI